MPRTKKQAIQKKSEQELRPASAVSAEIIQTNRRLRLIQLLDMEYSDQAIADELGMSVVHVNRIKNEILDTLTQNYIQAVDGYRARSHMRYERLYRVAEAMATGSPLPGRPLVGLIEDMPQKDWMKIALQIISAEAELMKADIARSGEKRDEDQEILNYTEIKSTTISRTSSLHGHAAQQIKETWGQDDVLNYVYGDEAGLLPLNPPADSQQDKLDNLDPSDLHAQLAELQKRLDKVKLDAADTE